MKNADYTGKKKRRLHRLLILAFGFWFLVSALVHAEQVRGLWVECEGTNDTLSSPEKLLKLISYARDTGVNTIFLQVNRHNRSWYNSEISDSSPYYRILQKYKIDPLSYTISHAHKYGIKVHAWINILRIGKDLDTDVIKKLGRDAITRDGKGRLMTQYPLSKLPDGGYWLDPGDTNVQAYVLKLVSEILKKYPEVDGIHMDYIRYPYLDLNPGSQFSNHKDFGYGKISVERFKNKYGYSPLTMNLSSKDVTQKWDDWRREQITGLVNNVNQLCKKASPQIQLSCAVQPWSDRAYLVGYQDWRGWINDGIVDFVVLMNYSVDRKLAKYLSETAIKASDKSPAYIGLGAYLLLKSQNSLYLQIKDCQDLKAKGIVLFSYDAILKNKDIFKNIAKNRWWSN